MQLGRYRFEQNWINVPTENTNNDLKIGLAPTMLYADELWAEVSKSVADWLAVVVTEEISEAT